MGRARIHNGDAKFTLRIYRPLFERVKAAAEKAGISKNELIYRDLTVKYRDPRVEEELERLEQIET